MKRISIYLNQESYDLIYFAAKELSLPISKYIKEHIIQISKDLVGQKYQDQKEPNNDNLLLPFFKDH
jgi:hypothetical protein